MRRNWLSLTVIVALALVISVTGVVAGAAGGFALARLAASVLEFARTPGMLLPI